MGNIITDNTLVQAIRNNNLIYRGLWKDFEDKNDWKYNDWKYDKDKNKFTDTYDTMAGLQCWELEILEEQNTKKQCIYGIKDKYEPDIVIALLSFKKELSCEEFKAIQNDIDNIKEKIEDWQFDDILEELHKFYEFEELDIHYRAFKV